MPLKRKAKWDTEHFHQFLLDRAHSAHAWGSNDCCLFAADGIFQMTDVDVASEFRGYKTQIGALRAIRKVTGGSTVEDAAVYSANKYGLTELKHPLMAQIGDLVLAEQEDGLLLGLVHLSGACVAAPGDDGLRRLPLTSIKRAWRV